MPALPYGTYRNLVRNPRPRADGIRPDWAGVAPTYDPAADGGTPSWFGPLPAGTTGTTARFQLAAFTFPAGTQFLLKVRAWVSEGTATALAQAPGFSQILGTLTTTPTTFVLTTGAGAGVSLGDWLSIIARNAPAATVLHVSQVQVIPVQPSSGTVADLRDALAALPFWDGDTAAIDQPSLYRSFSWAGDRARSASLMDADAFPPGGSGKAALPVGCQLWVDGKMIACHDPREGGGAAAPYALTGLTTTWGRDDLVSDPAGASLGVEVAVPAGTLPEVPIGSHVDVLAIGYEDGTGAPVNSTAPADYNAYGFTTGEWAPQFSVASDRLQVGTLALTPSDFYRVYHTFGVGMAPFAAGRAAPAGIGHRPPFWTDLPAAGAAGEVWHFEANVLALAASTDNGSGLLTLRMGVHWASGPILTDSQSAQDWLGGPDATIVTTPGFGVVSGAGIHWGPWQGYTPNQLGWIPMDSAAPFPGAVPTVVFSVAGPPSAVNPYLRVHNVRMVPPDGPREVPRTVFAGTITDAELVPPTDGFTDPTLVLQAVDDTSSLGQTKVGDQPWPAQSALARWSTLAGLGASRAGVQGYLDLEAPNWTMQWRDVDAQEWWKLAQDFARSVGSVAWPCYVPQTAAGRSALVVWVEYPDARRLPSVLALQRGADGLLHVVNDLDNSPIDADVSLLAACNLDREPVRFTQNLGSIYTRVVVRYLVMNATSDGTEQQEVTVVNGPAEERYGARSLTVDTGLATAAQATELAYIWLGRSAPDTWLASGLRLADDALLELPAGTTSADLFLPLLDSLQRPGRSLLVTDLPDWTPAPTNLLALTLEGGTYSFVDGHWVLEMNVSTPTVGQQTDELTWEELGTAIWTDFGPEVRWLDLRGVRRVIP